MYDWELKRFLQERQYQLESKEYLYMCNTCPQINHVKYNAFEDCFEIWTDCDYFKFKVYHKIDDD